MGLMHELLYSSSILVDAEMGSFPDKCEIEKSYLIRCSRNRCTRMGSSLRGFEEKRGVRGL